MPAGPHSTNGDSVPGRRVFGLNRLGPRLQASTLGYKRAPCPLFTVGRGRSRSLPSSGQTPGENLCFSSGYLAKLGGFSAEEMQMANCVTPRSGENF